MRYLSVCSGIEAATVAWHGLGWTPVGFSEIEPFPSAVLAHHHPHVQNVGDMTKFKEWNLEPIDLLVGGTPCQSFSVAGLRKGLDDPRGNLMLTFLAIAERYRPRWIVWENVPGVLSSNGGRDFGTFLGALGQLGYGWAYRVLDAQWFGVAQRRRRVFVVGCLGDQASAAAVLFESESVCRNPAPSRETRKAAAAGALPSVAGSLDTECGGGKLSHQSAANGHILPTWWDGGDVAATLTKQNAAGGQRMPDKDNLGAVLQPAMQVRRLTPVECEKPQAVAIPIHDQATSHGGKRGDKQDGKGNGLGVGEDGDPAPTLTKGAKHAVALSPDQYLAHSIGTDCYNGAITGEVAATIGTPGSSVNASGPTVMQAVGSFKPGQSAAARSIGYESEVAPSLEGGGGGNNKPAVHVAMQVRRLTPVECERLQGFPDGYTAIPWKKKSAEECPDGPRYKALGNSMAVPCMRWIGERIQAATARQEVKP